MKPELTNIMHKLKINQTKRQTDCIALEQPTLEKKWKKSSPIDPFSN